MIQAEEETSETQIQTSTHRSASSDDDEESKWHECASEEVFTCSIFFIIYMFKRNCKLKS